MLLLRSWPSSLAAVPRPCSSWVGGGTGAMVICFTKSPGREGDALNPRYTSPKPTGHPYRQAHVQYVVHNNQLPVASLNRGSICAVAQRILLLNATCQRGVRFRARGVRPRVRGGDTSGASVTLPVTLACLRRRLTSSRGLLVILAIVVALHSARLLTATDPIARRPVTWLVSQVTRYPPTHWTAGIQCSRTNANHRRTLPAAGGSYGSAHLLPVGAWAVIQDGGKPSR